MRLCAWRREAQQQGDRRSGKEVRMTVQREASNLWLFESHNNAKRSQWLQSTLSELEDKTSGMLRLIESDADTFAQRAEMYYKKRQELVNMIADFYRSYRSLAEKYDQLKLESGTAASNRGFLHKEWGFIDKSSSSSSVTFDTESEVDDLTDDEQVESKLKETPKKNNGCDMVNQKCAEILPVRMKRERADFWTYSVDSNQPLASYPAQEHPLVGSQSNEYAEKKADICIVKEMVEKVNCTTVNARNGCNQSALLHGVVIEEQDEENVTEVPERGSCANLKNLLNKESDGIKGVIDKMAEESPRLAFACSKARSEEKQKEMPGKNHNESIEQMIEVERLKEENMIFKTELERKDEEKREVIRQLSVSLDVLKVENDCMKKFIRELKNKSNLFEFRKLKNVFCAKLFGNQTKFPTTLVAI